MYLESLAARNLTQEEDGDSEDARVARQLMQDLQTFKQERLKRLAIERNRKEVIRIRERDKVSDNVAK